MILQIVSLLFLLVVVAYIVAILSPVAGIIGYIFTNIIFKDVLPSNEILESNFRMAIEEEIAIPHRICSMKNTRSCGAILFKKIYLYYCLS